MPVLYYLIRTPLEAWTVSTVTIIIIVAIVIVDFRIDFGNIIIIIIVIVDFRIDFEHGLASELLFSISSSWISSKFAATIID
jgi:hypothetical protein